jgi:hypothetical protein
LEASTTTDSTPVPVAIDPRRIGPGCLVWTAKIPALACLVVVVATALDYVWRGPVAPEEAAVIGLVAAAGTLGFVYYGALIETGFSPARALRKMPRVFLQDVLLLAIFGVLALLSTAGGRDFGGGGGGGGGAGGRSAGLRSNFASGLVDPVEFAGILGTQEVRARGDGFDGPMGRWQASSGWTRVGGHACGSGSMSISSERRSTAGLGRSDRRSPWRDPATPPSTPAIASPSNAVTPSWTSV